MMELLFRVLQSKVRLLVAALLCCTSLTTANAANIIIYGGTGNIGSRIVDEAVNRGHTVTVVSRSAGERQADNTTENLAFVSGDILDTESVTQLIAGQDVVISVVNSRETSFFTEAAESVVDALRAEGDNASRLIWVGGASSLLLENGERLLDARKNEGGATPTGAYMGHTLVLDYFRTLDDVEWSFVSPSMSIRPGERTGKFRIGGDYLLRDENGDSKISMEDFAVAIIDEIETPELIGKRFTVGY